MAPWEGQEEDYSHVLGQFCHTWEFCSSNVVDISITYTSVAWYRQRMHTSSKNDLTQRFETYPSQNHYVDKSVLE